MLTLRDFPTISDDAMATLYGPAMARNVDDFAQLRAVYQGAGYALDAARFSSIADMRAKVNASGSYFFSGATMKWFKSRVSITLYGNRFFITSELAPFDTAPGDDTHTRRYTVRYFTGANGHYGAHTIGDFGQYATQRDAMRAARYAAANIA